MKNKGTFTGFLIFISLLVVCAAVVIFSLNSTSDSSDYSIKKQRGSYIATIFVEGTIGSSNPKTYNQQWLLETIESLRKDANNKAIVVYLDTPGGSVYETDEVYLALKEYSKTGKKVYAYMASMAASGGYYIACGAQKIYANRNTLTGSIGVIAGQTLDISELLSKYGIKSETIHAGKNKNMGNYNEPLSEEQRQILQSIADECYDQFVGIVANNRNLSLEEVQKLADGRIYTAKQAKDLKLIDKIETYDNMISELKRDINDLECKVIDYNVPVSSSFWDLLTNASDSFTKNMQSNTLGLPKQVADKLNNEIKYPAYLYE